MHAKAKEVGGMGKQEKFTIHPSARTLFVQDVFPVSFLSLLVCRSFFL
jgi:hypothetical protein